MNYEITDFQRDVIERSGAIPVLVDFWAEWCGPCRILGPVLERLAEQHRDTWVLGKLDTEAHPDIAGQYGVRSIPNVKLFVGGKVIDEFTGALPETMILDWLRKALPSKHAQTIADARLLLQELRFEEARHLLNPIVAAEPGNSEATALLAKALFFEDPGRARALADSVEHGPENHELAEAIRTFCDIDHAVRSHSIPEGIPKNAFLDGASHLLAGRFDEAITRFIEVIREDRYYFDDASRKACIAVFKFLGENHAITKARRREFNSSLFR